AAGSRPVIVVFDDDWRERFRLDDVAPMAIPETYAHVSYNLHQDWPVERLAGGDVLAHHVDPEGRRYSQVHDLGGRPIGLPLPQVLDGPRERGLAGADFLYEALTTADDSPTKWMTAQLTIRDPLVAVRR